MTRSRVKVILLAEGVVFILISLWAVIILLSRNSKTVIYENPENDNNGALMQESTAIPEALEEIVEYAPPPIQSFRDWVTRASIIKGSYQSCSEYDSGSDIFNIFDIMVDDVITGDIEIGSTVKVVGEVRDSYDVSRIFPYEERYKKLTAGYFRQFNLGEEVMVFLTESTVSIGNRTERYFDNMVGKVYFVDEEGELVETLHPSIQDLQPSDKWRDFWERIGVNVSDIKQLAYLYENKEGCYSYLREEDKDKTKYDPPIIYPTVVIPY